MNLEPGSKIGPYEITGPIGAGGMGEVYRARDTRLGREVAIKVLPRELTSDPERLARFEREARSASALNHRNIVTIHDFSSRDGEAWLVMELIRGESLRELLSRGALPFKKVIAIGSGIADGLAAAHNAGIVHRDLKPENVMITSDGTPKILDFGLVKNRASNDITNSSTEMRVSSTGTILGTAGYMSPEQARGEEVDFRSDQFSLGLILYETATGKNPFRRATPSCRSFLPGSLARSRRKSTSGRHAFRPMESGWRINPISPDVRKSMCGRLKAPRSRRAFRPTAERVRDGGVTERNSSFSVPVAD
jgi:serine/threonine protein kinase